MEFLNVLIAAIAGFAFGAVWYMSLVKPWKAATGMTDEAMQGAGAKPYIISFIALLFVAGMMRHMFSLAGIDSAGKGLVAGLGLGLFIAAPWIATNYAYSMRPRILTLIDCGYAAGGCTVIGFVLTMI
ncbi:DUF1761 domain-containing protein [Halocynthiibacter styelae]|uniref:DUF1761 domain-containing protein n=1 Tax=Halocynthiibacter styelae TaxID=2761955 RepID=A0A8J7IEI4_9RHOB|nr:DUF1761 domain-containing protein [Paenihalocynthiibacter styelae]MBI1494819.1 DUF1761 domain-containing protein [Paenihalocynthiibacter styelae]